MRILIIEDDDETAKYILDGLRKNGHVAEHMSDGRDGLMQATRSHYDAIVIDRMLPGLDGLTIVKSMRERGIRTPVLFLTARAGIDDRVEGLNSGGDDYLTKPFANSELVARLNALTRRPPPDAGRNSAKSGGPQNRSPDAPCVRGEATVVLRPREFRLLEYLMRNAERVVTRTMLLEKVWEFHFDPKTKIVETHISRLRAKVDGGSKDRLIHTVRGAGYVIRRPT